MIIEDDREESRAHRSNVHGSGDSDWGPHSDLDVLLDGARIRTISYKHQKRDGPEAMIDSGTLALQRARSSSAGLRQGVRTFACRLTGPGDPPFCPSFS